MIHSLNTANLQFIKSDAVKSKFCQTRAQKISNFRSKKGSKIVENKAPWEMLTACFSSFGVSLVQILAQSDIVNRSQKCNLWGYVRLLLKSTILEPQKVLDY